MNYVVFKTAGIKEYRIYVESAEHDGIIIYKGHKLGVELNLLSQLIDFRVEKTSNRISVLNYEKITDKVNTFDKNQWLVGNSDNFANLLIQSWESIQKTLENKCGKFRKILITEVNI